MRRHGDCGWWAAMLAMTLVFATTAGATIIDNPDPVDLRIVEDPDPQRCVVRSVLDPVPEGCAYAIYEVPTWEIEDLIPVDTEVVPLPPAWLREGNDTFGWCDDTPMECASQCNDGCAKRGWTVYLVQFKPDPGPAEKQCACQCADPARTTFSITCSEEPRPQPTPKPEDVALPYGEP